MGRSINNPGGSVSLGDFPLTPEQIIEGSPQKRIWINAQSADKTVTQGV